MNRMQKWAESPAGRVRARLSTALLSSTLALCACDGNGEPETAPPPPPGTGQPGAETFDLEGCVVSVLATDCSSGLPVPHEIELLDAKTGVPLPGFRTTSAPGGRYSFKGVPRDVELAIHVRGNGPIDASASTYDTIALYSFGAGDNLLRVSSVGTASLTGDTAAFTPAQDRVAFSGAVYVVNDSGRRMGTIGCAQVFIDDEPHPAVKYDQRYNASSGLPTILSSLDRTLAGSGRFYLGNLSTGQHTLKVSLDGGKNFILERPVFISKVRADASSPFKSLLYLVGLDIKGPNPMPADCPTEERR
jgi:hypothetical protein